ncbi:MAG: acyl-CoA dehydrogenase family protein, partial [Actinomycetota bacterium]|nr:acyl-CoA dehydrogenase family protein [Actinomycetota bacterium]
MDFSIPDEYRDLLDSFRAFLDREVRPVEDRYRARLQDDEWDEEMREAGLALRRRSAELGFYGAHMPEEVGGWGLSTIATTLLVEEAAKTGLRFSSYVLG